MSSEEKGALLTQIQTDVTLISFLSVISIFFLGALLPQFSSYDLTVKIPISFLIVATFAFVFSALILSNASQAIIVGDKERLKKHVDFAYALSEYLGFFLLILSVPLAMSIVTEDLYIRVVTFAAAMLGFITYQFLGFSILERHFSKNHKLFATIIVTLGALLFTAHLYKFYFTTISVVLLVFLVLVTVLGPKSEIQ